MDSPDVCLKSGTGLTTGRVPLPFRCGWSRPSLSGSGRNRHGSRPAPPRACSPARIGCVVCSSAVLPRQPFIPSGRSAGRIISTRRKDLTLARSTAQRLTTYQSRYRELVAQLGNVGYIAVPLSRPARRLPAPIRRDLPCQLADTGGPIRLPGEKSHEPGSTHPRRPPRNRDWLLRCLSSGFGCLSLIHI